MKVVGCLTRYPAEWKSLETLLEESPAAVVLQPDPDDLLQALGAVEPDLLLVDARSSRPSLELLLELAAPSTSVLLVLPTVEPGGDEHPYETEQVSGVYDVLDLADAPSRQRRVLRRALEHSALMQKGNASAIGLDSGTSGAGRSRRSQSRDRLAPEHAVRDDRRGRATDLLEFPVERRIERTRQTDRPSERAWELALRSLSRSLSAGFDAKGLLEPFVDLAVELAGVARAVVLVAAPQTVHFDVTACRGLFGPMLRSYRHPRQGGLAHALLDEGRPLRRDDPAIANHPEAADIRRSFDVLQAIICLPLASMGELVGILCLGSRINGAPPNDEHAEVLFTIGSHVAAALQNIMLHQATAHQKAQSESVLAHMTNGIAAINAAGQVTVFNGRAGEILRLEPDEVLGQDLRVLPAPLGDFLFGALRSGLVSRSTNLILPGSGIPLEVSTYPLVLPGSSEPVGSVLVVEDITERRALDETRRHADQQEVLGRLISQLAHEIKNPLTAVKTFADLFPQHRDDRDFATFIEKTVIPDIARLDEIVGKLVDFVNHSVPQMQACRLDSILKELLDRMEAEARIANVTILISVEEDLPMVRADPGLLGKAISYLLRHLVLSVSREGGSQVHLRAFNSVDVNPMVDPTIVLEFTGDRAWLQQDEIAHAFDPLFVQKDELNLALPVARKIIQEHRGEVEAFMSGDKHITLRVTLQSAKLADTLLAEPWRLESLA